MKLPLTLLACCTLFLCGCAASSPPASSAPSPSSEASAEPMDGGPTVVNPMVPYDVPDFTEKAGFRIGTFPSLDGTVTLGQCWLIADVTAQLNLSFPDKQEGHLRVAVDKGEDISGVYSTFANVRTETVNGVEAELSSSTNGGPAMVRWLQNGYRFVLYFPEVQTALFEQAAAAFPGQVEVLQ